VGRSRGRLRIGIGYDVHRLAAGRRLVLGGVEIPFEFGLLGHSDADVLIHAICDALLGAAALGDIGLHFPDTAQEYEGIDSRLLLAQVGRLLRDEDWTIVNLDCTVIAQQPKLAPYVGQIRTSLSEILGAGLDQISVKATTTEGLGFEGRGEGIAAQAVVLLQSNK